MFDDFVPDRIDLLVDERRFKNLSEQVKADLLQLSPQTQVMTHDMHPADPWDFEGVYTTLYDFAKACPFDTEHEDYLVHITTCSHVAQICWFLLTEARYIPARLLQTAPPRKQKSGASGSYDFIDLDLARYDVIAQRFARKRADTATFLKSGIATRSAAFNLMIAQIERVASKSKAPILLMGPTGAGKSKLASNIYALKKSANSSAMRSLRLTAPRCAAMARPAHYSATCAASTPAHKTSAWAICAALMATCCS